MRTTLILWGLLGMVTASVAEARSSSAVLLSSSPREIHFRAEFEAPELRQETGSERAYTYPFWPGLAVEGEPGSPGLPALRVRVALPPGGEPELRVIVHPRSQLSGVRFPPLGEWEPQVSRRGQREDPRAAVRLTEGEAYRKYRPRPQVEIETVGTERGLRVATVVVRPVVWDSQYERAEWAAALEVTIGIHGGSPRSAARQRRPDRAGMVSWEHELLNPQDAELFRDALAPDTCAAGIPPVWFDDSDIWIKIEVDSAEIYGLTRGALEATGAYLEGVDPRTLRLYAGPLVPDLAWAALGWDTLSCQGGQIVPAKRHVYERPGFCEGFADSAGMTEIPLWVRGEEDGIFDPGDLVVFYGLGPDNFRDRLNLPPAGEAYFINPYSRHAVYWLTWESRLPGTPLRMEEVDVTPIPGALEVGESTARVHSERNTFEDPSLYTPGLRWERWFWDYLTSDQGAKRFTVTLPHVVPASTLDAEVRLWGARVPTRENSEAALHHVEVTVNGVPGDMAVWGGTSAQAAISPRDMSLTGIPSRNPSEFLFRVPQVSSGDPHRYDEVHLAWIDVTYRRELHLDGRAGELEIDPLPAGGTLRVAAPPGGALAVLDVSNPRRPRRLIGASQAVGELQVAWSRPTRGALAVAPEATLRAPASLRVDAGPSGTSGGADWLRETSEPIDYVIVVPEGWIPEANLLADWRTHHLYPITEDTTAGFPRDARVRVVGVEDIMDEFAWGMWDPAAIRYFLEYAFRFYGGPGDDPLSYCLLLGDATNDPRDYGGSGVRDYVPSWEDNRDGIGNIVFGNVQYVSDDPLARFDGPGTDGCEDSITDIYLGRVTASNRSEARDLIRDKIIRAEESPPTGPWRTKAILVADDICQGGSRDLLGTAHIRQIEAVADTIPDVFTLDKIYLVEYGDDCSILTKPTAKQDLIQTWTDGAWFVDYVGHGGDVVWADEHVLDLSDTPLLLNGGKLPVVGSFSCSVGKFSNPTRDGLGEAHLRSRSGGSLVTVAATHLTSSASNAATNFVFVQSLFSQGAARPKPAGVALMETKRRFSSSGSESDKYVCLGDPASPPMVPRETLALTGPPRLDRGTVASVEVGIPGGLGRSGTVGFDVRDSYVVKSISGAEYTLPGAPLYRGEEPAEADTALGVFTVPVSLRGGPDGRISVYASGTDWDAAGAIAPLEVGGTSVAGNDTVGPTIVFSVSDTDLESGENVTVDIEDVSGINITRLFEFRSILLKVLDRSGLEQLRQDLTDVFTYDLGSHTQGEVVFRVPDLEAGAYSFSISATDNFNNRNQSSLAAEVGSAQGAAEFEGLQAAYPNPFDPGTEPTQLMFSLTRSADVSLRIYSVSGRLVHQADLAAAAGPNILTWDGRDQSGDLVSNGVYLAQMTAKRAGSEESRKILERLVVLR